MSSVFMRRTLPRIIIVILTVWMVMEYFLAVKEIQGVGDIFRVFQTIIGTTALGLGLFATVRHHGTYVRKRTTGRWFYSVALLLSMTAMAVTGLIGWYDQPIFAWLWNNVTVPSQQTVYSLLLFYMAYASWRALRITNLTSTIFMVAAVIIMFMNAPVLELYFPYIAVFGAWLLAIPNVGADRGYTLATVGGTIAIYVRTLLGREMGMIGVSPTEAREG